MFLVNDYLNVPVKTDVKSASETFESIVNKLLSSGVKKIKVKTHNVFDSSFAIECMREATVDECHELALIHNIEFNKMKDIKKKYEDSLRSLQSIGFNINTPTWDIKV